MSESKWLEPMHGLGYLAKGIELADGLHLLIKCTLKGRSSNLIIRVLGSRRGSRREVGISLHKYLRDALTGFQTGERES